MRMEADVGLHRKRLQLLRFEAKRVDRVRAIFETLVIRNLSLYVDVFANMCQERHAGPVSTFAPPAFQRSMSVFRRSQGARGEVGNGRSNCDVE
jgi:hypothetical protein